MRRLHNHPIASKIRGAAFRTFRARHGEASPRLLADGPRLELGEDDFDSPERAFSLFTVRAAISSARFVDRPSSSSLFLTSLY